MAKTKAQELEIVSNYGLNILTYSPNFLGGIRTGHL